MRIKLDENMPAGLSDTLTQLGHAVETVPAEGLAGRSDDAVWAAAQHERRFLITQDLDFADARRYQPGTHAGLLLVRLRRPGRTALAHLVQRLFEAEDVAAWDGCLIVATEAKLRIRRP